MKINVTYPTGGIETMFSNFVQVTRIGEDYFLDFCIVAPQPRQPEGEMTELEATALTRVILTPAHAKRLIAALQESMDKNKRKAEGAAKIEGEGAQP